jgi:hypothetical protein
VISHVAIKIKNAMMDLAKQTSHVRKMKKNLIAKKSTAKRNNFLSKVFK